MNNYQNARNIDIESGQRITFRGSYFYYNQTCEATAAAVMLSSTFLWYVGMPALLSAAGVSFGMCLLCCGITRVEQEGWVEPELFQRFHGNR